MRHIRIVFLLADGYATFDASPDITSWRWKDGCLQLLARKKELGGEFDASSVVYVYWHDDSPPVVKVATAETVATEAAAQ